MCFSDMENKQSSARQNSQQGLGQNVQQNSQQNVQQNVQQNSQQNVQRKASLDIGTVTCRLLLADVSEMSFVELERRVAITNLGIGVDKTHLLQDDAIARVERQIAEYVSVINSYKTSEHPVIPITAVATSAARDAQNSDELVERLRALGVELSIIEGTHEAALSFRGAAQGHEGENLLVVDIGGGSTEIVLGIGGGSPKFSHSFNIGCRRMTERFMESDPPTTGQCDALRSYVNKEMKPYFEQARAEDNTIDRIIAVAGTPTSVVAIDKHLEIYDSSKVHNTQVSRETLERIYDELRTMTLEARKQVVGLEPARAGVIVAGLAILLEVLTLTNCSSFTVSESDILQGMLLLD